MLKGSSCLPINARLSLTRLERANQSGMTGPLRRRRGVRHGHHRDAHLVMLGAARRITAVSLLMVSTGLSLAEVAQNSSPPWQNPGLGGCPPGKAACASLHPPRAATRCRRRLGADIALALNNSAMPMQGSAVILIACFIKLASFAGFGITLPRPRPMRKPLSLPFRPATFCLHPASNVMKGERLGKGPPCYLSFVSVL